MIRPILPVILVVVAASRLCAAEPPAGWKSYASQSGAFTIGFPAQQLEDKETIQGLDGGGNVDQIQYVVGKADGAYLASYQPAANLAKSDAKTKSAALDLARGRLAASFAGKVVSMKEVKLDAESGREVLVDCPKIQGMLRGR